MKLAAVAVVELVEVESAVVVEVEVELLGVVMVGVLAADRVAWAVAVAAEMVEAVELLEDDTP